MSWFGGDNGDAASCSSSSAAGGWWYQLVCSVLKAGRTPRHIAFIMDGNRRFARRNHLASVLDGHHSGFSTLSKVLEWCHDLSIPEVTVYAFSIENFKRNADEVDGLMEMLRSKFTQLLAEKEKIAEHGARFRFFGNLALLPVDVQSLLKEVVDCTKLYNKAFINVCVAYTSRDEIQRAMVTLGEAVKEGIIEPSDVSEEFISCTLDTRGCSDPDLLIRTSGEYRLSDFMLWQALWPEISFYHIVYAVLHYQKNYNEIQKIKAAAKNDSLCCNKEKLNAYRSWLELQKDA